MTLQKARQIVGGIWCQEDTWHLILQPALAMRMAKVLAKEVRKASKNQKASKEGKNDCVSSRKV